MPVATIKAVATAPPYTVTLTDDFGHQWLADEPPNAGGANAGPSPARLRLSSLGAYTAITLQMFAASRRWLSRWNCNSTPTANLPQAGPTSDGASPCKARSAPSSASVCCKRPTPIPCTRRSPAKSASRRRCVTVLAGTANGQTAPTEVFSPLLGLDITALRAAQNTVPLNPTFEHAALILSGEVEVAGERLTPGTLLYLGCSRKQILLHCGAPARLMLIGGELFKEEILLWWNFVARTQEEMVKATEGWNAGRYFGKVKGSSSPRLVASDIAGLNLKGVPDAYSSPTPEGCGPWYAPSECFRGP